MLSGDKKLSFEPVAKPETVLNLRHVIKWVPQTTLSFSNSSCF